MRKFIVVVAVAAATALAAGACDRDSEDGGNGTGGNGTQATSGAPTSPAAEPAPAGDGTLESPLGTGVAFEVGDWIVEFGSTNPDAEDVIAEEVGFSEPPPEGRQYVMGEVTVTYAGAEPADPFVDLAFEFFAADGTGYGSGEDEADLCGLLPNDLFEVGDMSTDDTATANVCVAVPAEAIDGGVWGVEYLWDITETDRIYVVAAA